MVPLIELIKVLQASLVAQWIKKKKKSPVSAEDMCLIPGSGRSPGDGNGNPLQYSCLGNPMGREAWWATIHEVTELDMT